MAKVQSTNLALTIIQSLMSITIEREPEDLTTTRLAAHLAAQGPGVRHAALTTIGCICEWLEDAAIERH